jgi:hypothetical protein
MGIRKAMLLLALFGTAAIQVRAQAAAEAAGMSSNSATAAQAARGLGDFSSFRRDFSARSFDSPTNKTATPGPSKQRASDNLIAPSGPPPDEVNRRNFEQNAGKDAGSVLFRSVPSGASVFVNHLLVGHTPLLLFLAPGRYEVEMRGSRQETGHRTVGVMPKETQKVVIDLNQRYPSSVSLRW